MKRLQIRLPESVHERLARLAARDGVSLNQFMVTAVSNEIVRQETRSFLLDRGSAYTEAAFLRALEEIPDVPPDPEDAVPSDE